MARQQPTLNKAMTASFHIPSNSLSLKLLPYIISATGSANKQTNRAQYRVSVCFVVTCLFHERWHANELLPRLLERCTYSLEYAEFPKLFCTQLGGDVTRLLNVTLTRKEQYSNDMQDHCCVSYVSDRCEPTMPSVPTVAQNYSYNNLGTIVTCYNNALGYHCYNNVF